MYYFFEVGFENYLVLLPTLLISLNNLFSLFTRLKTLNFNLNSYFKTNVIYKFKNYINLKIAA